jgi:hypothetical protein
VDVTPQRGALVAAGSLNPLASTAQYVMIHKLPLIKLSTPQSRMQNTIKHVVRLAQQQALNSFAELVAQMLLDTNVLMGNAVRNAPPAEQAALNTARAWLHNTERSFRASMQAKYSILLERAMETMHTDLRAGLHDIRADKLSLVEDETITRQIELDRVVTRLRDVDEMSLGRINLTIASLHNVSQVRERENPFRPYLAARALYDSVRETVKEGPVSKVLFEHMAGAMANLLPGYYAAVLGHFENRGLDARLLAKPSELTRAQRERLAGSAAAEGMQGLQEAAWQALAERTGPNGMGVPRPGPDSAGIARPAAPVRGPARAQTPQRSWLDGQLKQLQQMRSGANAPAPLALSEQIGAKADPDNRVTIGLIGQVFDYVLREDLLAQDMRAVLGRLHVPLLRAAMLDPELLQDHGHPARSLLDRLGALAAALVPGARGLQALHDEAGRLVDQVRQQFEADTLVFANAEHELDTIVDGMLRQSEPLYARLRAAVEAADANGAQSAAMQKILQGLLAPLKLDPRLAHFIDKVWVKVMLRQGGGVMDATLLPELVWSAQAKPAPADRSVLMRALPDLVRRIREGIAVLGLPPDESKAALDEVAAVHMDVLGQRMVPGGPSTSLDWLHVHFAPLSAGSATATAAAPLAAAALEAVLARQGERAVVFSEPVWRDPMPADAEWLVRARPGARFETLIESAVVIVRLETVSADQSIFVFSAPAPALPLVYRKNALLSAMHAGAIRPVEYAPLFDRAISAAMGGFGTAAPA